MCSTADDDSLHVPFTCPQASQVWQDVNLRNVVDNTMCEFHYSTLVVF